MAQGDFTRINTNVGALNALNSLKAVQKQLGTAQLRLATGKRINEAADDPAGLTIATKFKYRASGLGVALDNIGDAKNMLAVAEGGLQKVNDILVQMRDKANQAASDTLGTSERSAILSQLTDFATEIDNIVNTTKWNGNTILDGLSAFSGTVTFQAGVDTGSDDRISLSSATFGSVKTTTLGIAAGSASSATVSDTGGIVAASGMSTAATVNGISELSSTNYTLRVVLGTVGAGNNTADSYAQLIDSNGNPMVVNNGGLNDNKVTFNYSNNGAGTGNNVINFGNGMKVTLANALTTGQKTDATVSYTKTGSYSDSVSNASSARTAVDHLVTAIATVSSRLQTIGSMVSRMNFREETLTTAKVNNEAAYSRIMDADMANEQLNSTKAQILQQTATAMLSQANQAPQGILQLFR